MQYLVIVILFLSVLVFIYYILERQNKFEKQRFREFVIAIKAKDLPEYQENLDNDIELEQEDKDEYVDISEIEPNILLNKIYDNNKNKNK